MKHTHYEVIVAWAEGKKVQHRVNGQWADWETESCPCWEGWLEYRIKPELKEYVYFSSNSTYTLFTKTEADKARHVLGGVIYKVEEVTS